MTCSVTCSVLQYSIFGYLMNYYKRSMEPRQFANQEMQITCMSGLLSGVIASTATNWLEIFTVAKQVSAQATFRGVAQQEGLNMLTKGLLPRVTYSAAGSIVFFPVLMMIGKEY